MYQRFIDHQRSVHTFVTNLNWPGTFLSLDGLRIVSVLPLAVASRNITVTFAVLSYADQLTITLVSGSETCPDLSLLRQFLQGELEGLVATLQRPSPVPG